MRAITLLSFLTALHGSTLCPAPPAGGHDLAYRSSHGNERRRPTTPEARSGAYMVYDAARGQTLLFGGWTTSGADGPIAYPDELWAWDGVTWRVLDPPIGTPRPVGRDAPVLAYDSARQRVVLFGGRRTATDDPRVLTDVWEWDGTRWHRIAGTGLPHLLHAVATYDPARRRVTLFSGGLVDTAGRFAGISRTLWEWDGANWSARDSSAPPNRVAGASSALASGALVYMTDLPGSNRDQPAVRSRTWIWNGSTWVSGEEGPSFNNLQGVASAPDGTLYFYQSWEQWLSSPILHIRAPNGTWRRVESSPSPGIRNVQAAAWDARRNRLVIFGGMSRDRLLLDDTWEFDGTTWLRR